jgi:ankyrin repeat protein
MLMLTSSLLLLSLQHVLDRAVGELLKIGKEQLMPLEGWTAWHSHGESLDLAVASYCSLLGVFRARLKSASSAVAQAILAATLDIAYPPRFMDKANAMEEQDKNILKYTSSGNYGIAYILHMRRLEYHSSPGDQDIQDMLDARNTLITSISAVIERQSLQEDMWIDLTETQLFIPQALFQIPAVAKAVEDDGRRDCLWRPIGHLLHDNRVDLDFRLSKYADGSDILGRTRLHLACALASDEQDIADLSEHSASMWSTTETLGLDALHIAAMHGHTYIFQCAAATGYSLPRFSDLHQSLHTGRTYLHWAACFGHLDLVEYLVDLYKNYNENTSRLTLLLLCRDRRGDTALHLAARSGHTEVVEAMVPQIDWSRMKRTCLRHTPFWAAVTGRHLDIMKVLMPYSNVDEDEAGGLTPLAEAARQGFNEGVSYLLQGDVGNKVDVNSINNAWDEDTKKMALKTPLDFAMENGYTDCVELLKEYGAVRWRDLSLTGS